MGGQPFWLLGIKAGKNILAGKIFGQKGLQGKTNL
jgi:hypothetical protein